MTSTDRGAPPSSSMLNASSDDPAEIVVHEVHDLPETEPDIESAPHAARAPVAEGAPPAEADVAAASSMDLPVVPEGRGSDPGRASEIGPQRATLPAITPEAIPIRRTNVMQLASGRSVAVSESGGEERLEVRAAGGELLVAVRLTDAGPVFSLAGATLEIAAAKSMSLRAETLSLEASSLRVAAEQNLELTAGGTLEERAAHAVRAIQGTDRTTATDVEVTAHPGAISLRANDDVDIVGERVRLNSDDPPMPMTWDEYRARKPAPLDAISVDQLARKPLDDEEPSER